MLHEHMQLLVSTTDDVEAKTGPPSPALSGGMTGIQGGASKQVMTPVTDERINHKQFKHILFKYIMN